MTIPTALRSSSSCGEGGGVLGKLAALQGSAGGREPPAGIAQRGADRLRTEVEAEQHAAPRRQRGAEGGGIVGYDRRCVHDLTRRTASACTFAQNSGMS